MPTKTIRASAPSARHPVRALPWLLAAITLLLPWFVLPGTTDLVEFPKTVLFVLFVMAGWIVFLLQLLYQRETVFRRPPFSVPLALFVLFQVLATVFSLYHYRSVVGTSGYTVHTLTASLAFVLFFLLMLQAPARQTLRLMTWGFFLSGTVIVALNFLQVFSTFILPWNGTRIVSFNAVTASPLIFASYLALLCALSLLAVFFVRRFLLRALLALLAALSFFIMLVYDQNVGWYALLLGLVALLVGLNATGRGAAQPWRLIAPTVVIGLTLMALFTDTQAMLRASIPGDVTLEPRFGWSIARDAALRIPIVGSGQETFDADFAKFRPAGYNATPLWNIRFLRSTNEWFQHLPTIGVVATVALFLLVFGMLLRHIRRFLRASGDDLPWLLGSGILLLGLIYLSFTSALSMASAFLLWSGLGASALLAPSAERPRTARAGTAAPQFLVSLGFSLFVIGGVVLGYFAIRFLLADWHIAQALRGVRSQEDITKVANHLARAQALNPYDQSIDFAIAQNQLVQGQLEAQKSSPDVNKIRSFITASIAAAQAGGATYTAYPGTAEAQAQIFAAIDALAGGSSDATTDAFLAATTLEPNNPAAFQNLGQHYLTVAQRTATAAGGKPSDEQKVKIQEFYTKANEAFTTASSLRPNYVEAELNLALAERLQGKAAEGTQRIEKLAANNGFDTDVLFNLAEAYRLDNRTDEAVAMYQRIVSLFPGNSDAHFRLAEIYESQGKTSEAIAELEIVKQYNPDATEVQEKLDALKKK